MQWPPEKIQQKTIFSSLHTAVFSTAFPSSVIILSIGSSISLQKASFLRELVSPFCNSFPMFLQYIISFHYTEVGPFHCSFICTSVTAHSSMSLLRPSHRHTTVFAITSHRYRYNKNLHSFKRFRQKIRFRNSAKKIRLLVGLVFTF